MERSELESFRRLCVSYGEARAKYNREDAPADYRAAWREDCDKLWKKIEKRERKLLDGLGR